MLSVHFRRIALAQGLLAATADTSPPTEATSLDQAEENGRRNTPSRHGSDPRPAPRPDSRQAS